MLGILLLLLLLITFTQDTYNYVPETKHVSRVCNCSVVAICATCNAISYEKRFVILDYLLLNRCAVPSRAIFCTSLILGFPGVLLRYFLNDLKWFLLSLLLLVSLLYFHSTYAVFILEGFYILKSCQLLS
jgi:hypothetical protein